MIDELNEFLNITFNDQYLIMYDGRNEIVDYTKGTISGFIEILQQIADDEWNPLGYRANGGIDFTILLAAGDMKIIPLDDHVYHVGYAKTKGDF